MLGNRRTPENRLAPLSEGLETKGSSVNRRYEFTHEQMKIA